MQPLKRYCAVLLLAFSTLVPAISAEYRSPKDIPAEIFAKLPEMLSPKLSPSGDYLGSILPHKGSQILLIQGFSEKGKESQPEPVVIPFKGLHLHTFDWVNDDYLIAAVRITRDTFTKHGTYRVAIRSLRINRKTGEHEKIDTRSNNKGTVLGYSYMLSPLPDEPNHILMPIEPTDQKSGYQIRMPNQKRPTERVSSRIYKVDIRTGDRELHERNPRAFNHILFDKSGRPRIGVHFNKESYEHVTLYHQPKEKDGWLPLEKMEYFQHERLHPHYIAEEDDNILVVSSRALDDDDYDQTDKDLYAYDLTQRKIIGPYEHPVHTPLENAIQIAVGDDYKVRLVSSTKNKQQHLFYIYSDQFVPGYFFFDQKEKQLVRISSTRSEIEHLDFSKMELFHYEARDGLQIPAYLTMPQNVNTEELPPLVVYPHGGPFARNYWGFDNMSQFLASRGYAVLQPQFRGSRGFGVELEEAGYQQWGYAMQNDITDGIKHLIKEEKVDPERVCIMGASYGGYATGMGLVKTPDLYNCGISINGVMDLVELRYDIGGHINERMINSKRDSKNVSPIHHAEKITAPLLLIVGDTDAVVPPGHSFNMHERMQELDKHSELVVLKNGEHWRTNQEHQIAIFEAVEKFLAEHL